MKNHKWKHDCCERCMTVREKRTFKTLMAIEGSRNYYHYESKWVYLIAGQNDTTKRPDCK